MKEIQKLLGANKDWAKARVDADRDYFDRLSHLQSPEFLWIGCSDSRVPANEITGTHPGEIFVHRNIANLVIHTDLNLLSVLSYAVEILHVKHIIVCGHYGCGGVKAAMTHQSFGIINKWLRNIKDVYRLYQEEIDQIPDEEQKVNKMVELTVKEQVSNLAKTSIIQKAWAQQEYPHLHGWVYGLEDGIIRPVFEIPARTPLDPIYQFEGLS